jgi:prevent-host-death family protein
MAFETTYTSLRENLAGVLDRVADDHEVVLVRRKGQRDVALVPAGELADGNGPSAAFATQCAAAPDGSAQGGTAAGPGDVYRMAAPGERA